MPTTRISSEAPLTHLMSFLPSLLLHLSYPDVPVVHLDLCLF